MSEWSRRVNEQLPEILGSLSNDIKKYSAPKQNNDNGFSAGLFNGGANVIGGVADIVDATTGYGRSVGDYMNTVAQENARVKDYTLSDMVPFANDYYTNPQGFRYGLGQTLGSSLTLMLPGGVAGKMTTAVIGHAAKGAVGKTLTNLLGGTTVRKLGTAGLFSAPIEAASEGGNLYRDMTSDPYGDFKFTDQQGKDAAATAFWRNLPILAVGNTLEGVLLGGAKLPGVSRIGYGDGLAKRALKKAVPPMLINGLQEGTTEALQEGITGNLKGDQSFDIWDTSTYNNPLSETQKMAAGEAFLMSGIMGGVPGAVRGARSKPQPYAHNLAISEGDNPDLDNLTGGMNKALPYVGGVLNDLGFGDAQITSGYRDEERNRNAGGVDGSNHTKGDAVDIYLGNISDERADSVLEKFRPYFGEVLYHDAGSGKHLHLAEYNGGFDGDNNVPNNTSDNGSFEDFVAAISGQESGGNYNAENGRTGAAGKYQIMPENWPSWAVEAGLSAEAEMTPENQELVGRYKLKEYYDKHGARGAAIAWYAGEGALNYSNDTLNRKQGNGDEPSINEYADSIVARMGKSSKNQQESQPKFDDLNSAQQQGIIDWAKGYQATLSDVDNMAESSDYEWLNENINNPTAIYQRYPQQVDEYLQAQELMAQPTDQIQQDTGNEKAVQETSNPNYLSDNDLIARAIAYHDRTNDPNEKILLESLVNTNSASGIRTIFPFLANENSPTIPQFVPPKMPQFIDPKRQDLLSRMATAINTNAMNKIDQLPGQYQSQRQDAISNIIRELDAINGQKSVNEQQTRDYDRQQRKADMTKENNGFMPEEYYTDRTALHREQNRKDYFAKERDIEYAKLFDESERRDYGKALIDTAKQQGIKADYRELEEDIYKNVAKATKFLEDKLTDAEYQKINHPLTKHGTDELNLNDLPQMKSFRQTLTTEENLYLDFLQFEFKETGVLFDDILNELNAQKEEAISNYTKTLEKQMAQGVEKKSVVPDGDGGFIFSPGYSLNYQWYKDMLKAAGKSYFKKISKKDLSAFLRDTAIEHLSKGYTDPLYGEQVTKEMVDEYTEKGGAIYGIEQFAEKARKFEAIRDGLPHQNKESSKESHRGVWQETIDQSRRYGQLLKEAEKIEDDSVFSDTTETENGLLFATGVERENTELPSTYKSTQKNEPQKSNTVFGDVAEAEEELLSSLGLERAEKKSDKKAFNIVDDSDEAIYSYIKQFKKAQNGKLSANIFLDPELMIPAFKIGAAYIQRGANQFVNWSIQMKDSLGEAIEPWLQSIWRSIESYPKDLPFNEKQMSAAFKYAGAKYESGIHDPDQIFSEFEKLVGKEKAATFKPLINSSFAGIDEYFNPSTDVVKSIENEHKDGVSDELNDSANTVAARDSQGGNQDTVGTDDGSRESVGRGEQSLQPPTRERSGKQRNVGVHDSSTDSGRKTGDSTVRTEESTDTQRSAGDTQLSRGVVDSYEGMEIERSGTNGITGVVKDGRNNESDSVKHNDQKKNKSVKFKAGDLDSIRNDLPMLLPEQQEDVVKAEKRFIENGEQGMLFTNGTGTGKTFTGLGVIKRMIGQGRDNILIISPQQDINNQWIEAAEKYFGIKISALENTSDIGKGVTITTYANFQNNDALAKRNWDLIITDEAHNLMNNENGDTTTALNKLRALTHHVKGFYERFKSLFETKEIRDLKKKLAKAKKEKNKDAIKSIKRDIANEYRANEGQHKKMTAEWEAIPKDEKTKVVFLSATPFAYDKDVDYAEGYLFDYPESDSGSYNSAGSRDKFMIENFGYRMRYNKLTRPESSVDNRIMEVEFHEKLRKSGALSGRKLSVDKDYDRGFLLVDGGIGKKIDEGFDVLRNEKNGFKDLYDVLTKQFGNRNKNYLLESIKARESIKFIQEYLDSDKKVVVFHDSKKERQLYHPFKFDENTKFGSNDQKDNALAQYKRFKAEYPQFANLNLSDLKSPIETLTKAFGDNILLLNGDVSKKQCSKNVSDFNSDDSGKNIILVQSDKGNAGISLHDVTGKHQRVLINLGIPRRPTYAIQIEGRIYRTGNASNAIFRYLSTGTELEKGLFANTVAQRASTAENLALGEDARNLRDSFVSAFMETLDGTWVNRLPNAENEGIGGIETDKAANDAISEFDRARTFYYAQQKKNAKTKSKEGTDYFATPEPLGLKMVEWANLRDGESVLEPSAGHGAIARFFSPNNKSVAVEPSQTLSPILQMNVDGANVIGSRFEDYYIGNKFDAVVMNPPFGSGGKTAVEHVKKAFGHLRDGGRIVAIVPDGPSCQKHLDKWLYGDDKGKTETERRGEPAAVPVKEILLPGVTFKNAGTQVNCKVIIIDKQESQAGRDNTEAESLMDLRSETKIEGLFDRIENISAPERYEGKQNTEQEAENSGNFTKGEHRHTKTGEMIASAKLNEQVEDFKVLSALAKRHKGYYSRVSRSFLFPEGHDARDQFVIEADALLGGGKVKLSTGQSISLNDLFDSMEFIEDERLVKKELDIAKAGENFGTPVVFFKADRRFDGLNGFHRDGVTFINLYAHVPHQWVFWHETFHWMRNNNQELYGKLLSYFKGTSAFTQKQLDAYREEIGRPELTNDEAIEEMLSDAMADVSRRVGLMKQLGKENPPLAERLVAWIKDMMERFHEHFTAPTERLTPEQKKNMMHGFTNLARDMVDANGKPIFKCTAIGKIYLQRNGEPVSSVLKDTAPAYSTKRSIDKGVNLADNVSKEEERYLKEFEQNILDKIKKDGAQILRKFDPADGLEALREKFVSKAIRQERNKWLNFYEKHPSSNFAILKIGQLTRQLGLERKELLKNDRILLELERAAIQENSGGAYTGILERIRGIRGRTAVMGRSGRDNRQHREGNGETEQTSRLDLKTPAEYEPQGVHLTAYKEALEKYDRLMKDKASSEQAYNEKIEHPEKGAFSMHENNMKLSVSPNNGGLILKAIETVAKKLGIKVSPLKNVKVQTSEKKDVLGILDTWLRSPSEIAKTHPVFRPFFDLSATAVGKQERLRNKYAKKMKEITNLLKNESDLASCTKALLDGDRLEQEFSIDELKQLGMSENAIRAYRMIRNEMKDTYTLINNARMRIRDHSECVTGAQVDELQGNKFVTDLQVKEVSHDLYLVSYKAPKTWTKRNVAVTEDALQEMRDNENIQIIRDVDAGDGVHRISYTEQMAPLVNRTGYIPHFFHQYFIIKKEGEKETVIGSGKTLADAVELANEVAKKDASGKYIIRQKGFDFDGNEREIAAVVGDHEFARMASQIRKHTDMKIDEAKEYLRDNAGVSLKNRHRFYGNALHRKGVEGFETDLLWLLNHHFNTSSRYVAMEDFKPAALNLFERHFGRFDNDWSGNSNAKYIKDYINDVNGNPTAIENKLNETLKNNPYFQSVLGDYFGDRPALQISSGISGTMAKAKLGFLNASSALLNLTQFLNIVGRLESYEYAVKGMQMAFDPTEANMKIIDESGVLDNINIAADAGGYTQMRGGAKFGSAKGKLRFAFKNLNAFMEKGMFFFTKVDALMRKAAILGAYHQAINEKGYTKEKAMEYAKTVNREANFDYGAHDTPNIIRRGSVLTQNALQFQKFPIKELEFMWNILNNGGKKQLYTFWLPFLLIAGVGQFPFAGWLDDLIDMLTRGKFKPSVDGKKALMDWAGNDADLKIIANALMYGGASVAGVDISQRAGMGNVFTNMNLAGPAGSTVSQMVWQTLQGNTIETFKAFSPGIGNVLQAIFGETRTTRHRVGSIYDGWDRIVKAAGFRTLDEAVSADVKTILLAEKKRKQKREAAAIDDYIEDPTSENLRRVKELKITPKRVQDERRKKKMSNRERTIDSMSKQQRQDLSSIVDFSN